MSKKKWIYEFTFRHQRIREGRTLSNICYYCGVAIRIGDKVYSRNANSSKSRSKLYHERCAIQVNIL